MSEEIEDTPPIWDAFCTALGTEHRGAKEIIGASGLVHPVEAIGVDDKGKRIVLVSSEFNPRISALMRGDVQATMPSMRVLVARPLAIDLAHAARSMFFTESGALELGKLLQAVELFQAGEDGKDQLTEMLGPEAKGLLTGVKMSSLRISTIVLSVVDQFIAFDWGKVSSPVDGNYLQSAADVLTQFSQVDNLAGDRAQGICPIPTYELTEADWELFHKNKQIDEIQSRLKDLDIFQYFFPPTDRLALGLIDRNVSSEEDIAASFNLAQVQGHELSKNTIVPDAENLRETMAQLKIEGYVMEGEFTTELSEGGEAFRKTIKVRPSEGLITKLSQIVSVKIDLNLKDLLGGK
ncbi:hypothetical protein [Sedimentitalea nanhaiensis]|uniref:Uncharacterized protein n=1 Tax=Sedimentitalea nanhaiensis TaxID=999627 RepID=A0A1I7CL63_9RHOB|nr:hypothetical protein [Sedimentitalea nanhaiensis]SFU00177.1 hypothetical protein SAMN05216236_11788 [Sedimentitalea nanhaiensis]